jgi:hypothetical protein
MSHIVATWSLLKKLCGAAFLIPYGVLLVVGAAWIVWNAGGHWLAIGASAWLGYKGVNTIIGTLAGVAGNGGPGIIDTQMGATQATRIELRRAGLLKRN